ncbi:MAG: hypothetical protein A2068_11705 [Ignavibacteria bacterium GWB2_35_6b]|nr:MAG: hypothetical protein A2068_11705 [Ignavibacteria bacterium GWB2_35_6b]
MKVLKFFLPFLLATILISCAKNEDPKEMINNIAESYVKLSLKAGLLDPYFVDAYYGPAELKPAENTKPTFESLIAESDSLITKLNSVDTQSFDNLWKLRHNYLLKQMIAVKTRLEMVSGKKFTFDEQAKLLFDTTVPTNSDEYFESLTKALDEELPGKGDFDKRLENFNAQFRIPTAKVDTVFSAAIAECRRRALQHVQLPANENFTVEYVTNQPWGAYNWYKGNAFSLIQVNMDLPKSIDGPVGLAAHEGYPGHHVYNALLEQKLLKEMKWIEFSIYVLFSPQSLIAEGSANYGVNLIFPGDEKIKFEKEILFPLAGLDSSKAEKFYRINELTEKLNYATNEAARNYIDGKKSKEETIRWLQKYALSTREKAEKSLSFIESYQSYVINYNLGEDIVKNYIEKKTAGSNDVNAKWEIFKEILTNPYSASELVN